MDAQLFDKLIIEALDQARQAIIVDEVPVGAVIWHNGEIISRAHNLTESLNLPSAHAEHLVIEDAAKKLKRWRLDDVVLAVTLEPCTMCAGLIRQARIPTVVFGAQDERAGAVGSLYDILSDARLGAVPRVVRDVMARECAGVLTKFFETKRR